MKKQGNTLPLPLKAVTFAAKQHHGQMRKDDETPYIAHPVRVMTILSEVFGVDDEEVLAAGVLHDTIEDTDCERKDLERKFGKRVASYVDELSKDMDLDKPEREKKYASELEDASVSVRLCKLADLYDNLSDTKALSRSKIHKTAARAERLVDIMTSDFPEEWQDAVLVVRRKIQEVKRSVGDSDTEKPQSPE
ncbi:HD domain-containing protein [Pseudobacteriovorax antillogorgiicola]|uniref:HD domain-containing protein n=1 Tax=Pseudobacteriovorax antillogorgiicola TaxID=1513793 RepID=A0A1Y6BX63_9BACT|nr:HD domain-containing protein [Pseudobacteriovorax antillogorgiicola]TCS53744.1 HD domain-containing protein [Pseudobacteriovorax antillogorgiicola]SMF22643.1 HD domain-containing protein [Pseudobacteriovorax antillogorgiicola]